MGSGGVVGLAVLGAWRLGHIPDGIVGWPLLIVAVLGPVLAVARQGWRACVEPTRRALVLSIAVGALGAAAVAPTALLSPSALLAQVDGREVALPSGSGADVPLTIHVHAEPTAVGRTVPTQTVLETGKGYRLVHGSQLRSSSSRNSSPAVHDFMWSTHARLGDGARLRLESEPPSALRHVHIDAMLAPPPIKTLMRLGTGLVALALAVALSGLKGARVSLAALAVYSSLFSVLFAQWYVPETLAKTAFGAAAVAGLAAVLLGLPLDWIAARFAWRRRTA